MVWSLLPAPVRNLPSDLVVVSVIAFGTLLAVSVPGVRDSPVRAFVGVPFTLFIPGYLLVSVLFPEGAEPDASGDTAHEGLSNLARFGLSFPASILVVAPLSLMTVFTPWGLQVVTVFPLLFTYVLGTIGLTVRRRQALPPEERFRPPFDRWMQTVRVRLTERSQTDIVLNVLLGVSIVLATAAVVYGLAVPPAGEPFTELYLTPVDNDNTVPNATLHLSANETESLQVTVRNRERTRVQYDLLVVRQRVRVANNSVAVRNSGVTDQYHPTLVHNQTWRETYTISVGNETGLFRVAFLLYKDGFPESPTVENAYRQNTVFLNATIE